MKRKSLKLKLFKARFVAYVATSIDGKISLAERTPPDWTSKEDWAYFQKGLSGAEAIVVGRNTYLAAEASLKKRNTFVLSSRIKNIQQVGKVTWVNPRTVDLKKLFASYKKIVVAGGPRVYQTMLEKGLLDEIYVTIEPLLFGRGKEMFIGGKKTSMLTFVSMRHLNKTGTILLHYRVQ